MAWLTEASCSIDDFIATVEHATEPADYPHAARVEQGAVVYDSSDLRAVLTAPGADRVLMSEIVGALSDGPGMHGWQFPCCSWRVARPQVKRLSRTTQIG